MNAFLLVVVGLSALALLCVLPPLLRRAGAGNEPPARRSALALALLLPAAAAALYLQVGRPEALQLPAAMQAQNHGPQEADIPAMVEKLAARLRNAPEDIEGWHMLARSYSAMGRHADAAQAYAHLAARLPNEAGLLADYADALASANDGALTGEPERLVARALELDPQQVKALALSASIAFNKGDYDKARQQWQAVLALVPEDSEFARFTQASIEEAERASGAGGMPQRGTAPLRLSGTVRLAKGVSGIDPAATVFVYARAAQGPAMPLAVLRRKASELPFTFTLDDSMAMTPGMRLSDWPQVVVGARISPSGSATPQPGDLEARVGPLAAPKSELVLEIDGR